MGATNSLTHPCPSATFPTQSLAPFQRLHTGCGALPQKITQSLRLGFLNPSFLLVCPSRAAPLPLQQAGQGCILPCSPHSSSVSSMDDASPEGAWWHSEMRPPRSASSPQLVWNISALLLLRRLPGHCGGRADHTTTLHGGHACERGHQPTGPGGWKPLSPGQLQRAPRWLWGAHLYFSLPNTYTYKQLISLGFRENCGQGKKSLQF